MKKTRAVTCLFLLLASAMLSGCGDDGGHIDSTPVAKKIFHCGN